MAINLELVSNIYDTVLQPDNWQDVLDQFANEVQARSSVLLVTNDNLHDYQCVAFSPVWKRRHIVEYLRKFYDEELKLFQRLAASRRHGFISDTEMLGAPDANYAQQPINEWMAERLNIGRRAGSGLHRHNAWTGVITLQFDKLLPEISPAQREIANAYIHHFSKAVELNRTLWLLKSQYDAMLSALDYLNMAVAVCDDLGRVILQNNTAQEITDTADGLIVDQNKRFRCSDSASQNCLDTALQDAIKTAQATGEKGSSLVVVERSSLAESYLVEVTPLKDGQRELEGDLKGALVFIIDPNQTRSIRVDGLEAIYKLTRSESMVCQLVVDGRSEKDIADLRNVSVETIKSQIKAIRKKTHTNNRGELIRLAMTINPPVRQKEQ